jgi:hypothetical protein
MTLDIGESVQLKAASTPDSVKIASAAGPPF